MSEMNLENNTCEQQKKPLFTGLGRSFLIIIPFFIFTGILSFPVLLMTGADIFNQENWTLTTYFFVQLSTLIGAILVIGFFRNHVDQKSFYSLGFSVKNRLKDVFFGLFLAALLMSVGFAILLKFKMINVVSVQFNLYEFVLTLGLFMFVGITEELLFRGYILNNLMDSMKKFPALMLSSFLFAAVHALNPNFGLLSCINLLLVGVLLGVSYIYTKNLWFPMALHFSWNFCQGYIFGFNVSGTAVRSVITQIQEKETLITGGNFGFEGSLLCTGLSLVAIVVVWRSFKNQSSKSKSKSKSSTKVGVAN